ncbi:MAG: response regulator [Hyphomicrobiales bacterium]|nr:response regulator [Hyphomicrobiales bacterium]
MKTITFARLKPAPNALWIYVVDDNADDRRAVCSIFASADVNVRAFDDGQSFLASLDSLNPGCVVLDVRMPGIDGLSVMEFLSRRRPDWPVVMMSNQSSIPIVVRAMQRGARHFVDKPCDGARLKDAIAEAQSVKPKDKPTTPKHRQPLCKLITPREMDVLRLSLLGQQNKSVAYALGISERTVEVHRA